jgi:hypothetical protein
LSERGIAGAAMSRIIMLMRIDMFPITSHVGRWFVSHTLTTGLRHVHGTKALPATPVIGCCRLWLEIASSSARLVRALDALIAFVAPTSAW